MGPTCHVEVTVHPEAIRPVTMTVATMNGLQCIVAYSLCHAVTESHGYGSATTSAASRRPMRARMTLGQLAFAATRATDGHQFPN